MEARVGIEPTYKGFADLSLTTWVPRPCHKLASRAEKVYHRRARLLGRKLGYELAYHFAILRVRSNIVSAFCDPKRRFMP